MKIDISLNKNTRTNDNNQINIKQLQIIPTTQPVSNHQNDLKEKYLVTQLPQSLQ